MSSPDPNPNSASMMRALGIALLVVGFAGIALRVPAVTNPFMAEDLDQIAYLAGCEGNTFSFRNNLDLFRFFDGDVDAAAAKMADGALPWRFDAEQKAAFFRPVASALLWLDHALFGMSGVPCHIHSLLWFLAFLVIVRRLYGYLLTPAAANVALAAVAVGMATSVPVRWWAARNAILAAVFSASALLFHIKAAREGQRRHEVFALICLGLALLSAEAGLQGFVFLFAYSVVTERGIVRIARSLAPSVVLLIAYLGLRASLGYGNADSALYIDPLSDPRAYFENVVANGLSSTSTAFSNLGYSQLGGRKSWVQLVAFGSVVLLAGLQLLRRQNAETKRLLLWLLVGALLALAPSLGAQHLRIWSLIIPQIGVHAILGVLIADAWVRTDRGGAAVVAHRTIATGLAAICLMLPLREHWQATKTVEKRRQEQSLEAQRSWFSPAAREAIPRAAQVYLLRSRIPVLPASYLGLWFGVDGASDGRVAMITLTDHLSVGAGEDGAPLLTRVAPDKLRIEASTQLLHANDTYRYDDKKPLVEGQTISLPTFSAKIEKMHEGRVTAVEFTFSAVLDAPDTGVLFLTWDSVEMQFEVVRLPPVGASMRLP